ncbi:maleylacetate reductase [Streptomyces mirabilis]|uniref:maleylacetate reductase n=1 Tax=Streptomyces mirabilis TaxID=68239 RepID=UPI00332D12E2
MTSPVPERVNYEGLPGTVVFGPGAVAELPDLLTGLKAERVTIIDGLPHRDLADRLAQSLGNRHALTIRVERQHVPADLAKSSNAVAVDAGTDWLVSLGGGSSLGVAKAIAHESGLSIAAIPTTYAGSEMTPIWGITSDGAKAVGRDLRVLPRLVVYDPELTVSLSPTASGASGMNAVAHCVEAYWTEQRNPVTDAVSSEALTLLATGLPRVAAAPADISARSDVLKGAWLAGAALAVAGTAIHHKICHVLGGSFDLPHAEVHASVLPWVVDHFRDQVPWALRRIAKALGTVDAVDGLQDLARKACAVTGLADLGLGEKDADRAADLVAAGRPSVPAPVSRDEIRTILARAMAAG